MFRQEGSSVNLIRGCPTVNSSHTYLRAGRHLNLWARTERWAQRERLLGSTGETVWVVLSSRVLDRCSAGRPFKISRKARRAKFGGSRCQRVTDMALEWGSVADWVGAIGGASGAATAAAFYYLDRRRAQRALEEGQQVRGKWEESVTRHTYMLMQDVVDAAKDYRFREVDLSDTNNLRAQFASYAATATRLLQLHELPIELFMDLSDVLEAVSDRRLEGRDAVAIRDAVVQAQGIAAPIAERLAAVLRI